MSPHDAATGEAAVIFGLVVATRVVVVVHNRVN